MKLPRSRVPLFLSQELVVLEAESEVDANFGLDEFTLEPQPPRFIARAQWRADPGAGAAPVRLRPAHHDRGRDGERRVALAAGPQVHHALFDARFRRGGRGGGADAPRGLQRPGRAGALEPARRDAVVHFFARDYPRWQKEWEVSLEERLEHSTAKNFRAPRTALPDPPLGRAVVRCRDVAGVGGRREVFGGGHPAADPVRLRPRRG